MLNNNYVIKEFFDLNGYYLKVSLYNEDIHIVCYNSKLLNGIKYETKITSEEMLRKSQSKNFTTTNLFELILKKIVDNKFIIKSDQLIVSILLLETSNAFNLNKDIQLMIPKNKGHVSTEYENILMKEINKLKEENKKLLDENLELKNLLKKNNNQINNNIINKQAEEIHKSLNLMNSQNKLKTSENNNNIAVNNNLRQAKSSPITQPKGDNNNVLITHDVNILSLSKLNFLNYPKVEISPYPFSKIRGFGANSYNGIARDHNEDRLKIILNYETNKTYNINGNTKIPKISFFAVYDGHGGNKCCNFVKEKLHEYIFESEYCPQNPLKAIEEAYDKTELAFEALALDKQNKKLIDKSGSCALTALIIDEWCYISYLGDSRGLYSYDSGNQLFQVTRDHKPNDIKERTRIEKAGGHIYKDTRLKINGLKVKVNEKDAPGVKFPYRVSPGNLSVRLYFIIMIYLFR